MPSVPFPLIIITIILSLIALFWSYLAINAVHPAGDVAPPPLYLKPLSDRLSFVEKDIGSIQTNVVSIGMQNTSLQNRSAQAAAAFRTDTNLTSVYIITAFGIGTIIRNSAGNYTVTFASQLETTPIITVGLQRTGTNDIINVYNVSNTGFSIEDRTGTTLQDNMNYISFVCFCGSPQNSDK